MRQLRNLMSASLFAVPAARTTRHWGGGGEDAGCRWQRWFWRWWNMYLCKLLLEGLLEHSYFCCNMFPFLPRLDHFNFASSGFCFVSHSDNLAFRWLFLSQPIDNCDQFSNKEFSSFFGNSLSEKQPFTCGLFWYLKILLNPFTYL